MRQEPEKTPDYRHRRATQLKSDFDRALEEARRAGELRDADEDEEISRVSIEGPPSLVRGLLARVRHSVPPSIRSMAPKSRRGKVVLGGVSIGALVSAAVALVEILKQAGVFEP